MDKAKEKRLLPVLFGTLLLDTIGVGMLIPILPIIFTDPSSPSFLLTGYSQSGQYIVSGIITALFGFMQFLAAPILGELSDVYGRKRLLLLGVGVLALSQFVFGFGIELASLSLLFFARAVAGIAGGNFSIAQATIADVTDPKDRAKNFGLVGAAFGIGFILGPLLSGWIATLTSNPAAPFWVAGGLGILNMLFLTFFLPETHVRTKEAHTFTIWKGLRNLQAAFRDVDVRPVYLSSFLYMSGFTFFITFIGILLVSRFSFSEVSIGTFFAVVGAWIVFTQVIILRIFSKFFSERKILRFSIPLVGVVMMLYPFMPNVIFLYALLPLFAIPQGLTMANMNALISKAVSPEKQGAALGINSSLLAFAQGVIPIAAGLASGVAGLTFPFVLGGLLIIISWTPLFLFKKHASLKI